MLKLHGWPEATDFMQGVMRDLNDPDVVVDNDIDVYSDDYAFVAAGIPSATLRSRVLAAGASSGAYRGYVVGRDRRAARRARAGCGAAPGAAAVLKTRGAAPLTFCYRSAHGQSGGGSG
jgi:hypothetical protein